ncbi:MAG: helix-turn-helix domain-containing protein [Lachnospiraceae bacterium]|nr:helix-turn-helix domain-containing protein [Lachnospiraceae bacterium]
MECWTIKEASKKLGVEAHVLRYWEEELGLLIKRNDMGHRYYDERDIQMFFEIQMLKEQGFLLKDIREAIKKHQEQAEQKKKEEPEIKNVPEVKAGTENIVHAEQAPHIVYVNTAQLQSIMNRIVANALRDNCDIIKSSVKEEITKEVIHQFDIVMRENEEREEERFRKLDESLRKLQLANEEVAATKMRKKWWRR